MVPLNELLKNQTLKNTAIGIGAAILVPIVAKTLAPFVRPVSRSALKISVVAFEKGRETFAEFGEIIDDMVAEVREEMRAERAMEDAALANEIMEPGEAGDILAERPNDDVSA